MSSFRTILHGHHLPNSTTWFIAFLQPGLLKDCAFHTYRNTLGQASWRQTRPNAPSARHTHTSCWWSDIDGLTTRSVHPDISHFVFILLHSHIHSKTHCNSTLSSSAYFLFFFHFGFRYLGILYIYIWGGHVKQSIEHLMLKSALLIECCWLYFGRALF